jgi:hypothetical protein
VKAWGRLAITGIVLVLVVVRLFTETLGVLPRLFNAADLVLIPALVAVVLGLRGLQTGRLRPLGVEAWLLVFCAVWLFSSALNVADLFAPASLLFLVGHVLPIFFAIAVTNLNPGPRFARRLVRLVYALAFVGVSIGLTQIDDLAVSPDLLAFTFGTNANQTALFLALVLSILLARWYYGAAGRMERLAALLLIPFFFLAGFKATWVLFPLVVVFSLFVAGLQNTRRLFQALVILSLFLILCSLIVAFVPLPELSYYRDLANFDPFRLGKVQIFLDLPEVWDSQPWGALVGVGPGSFTSRGFRTFADLPFRGAATDVTYTAIPPTYMSPLAARYVVPLMTDYGWQLGSGTIQWPFSSYISLLAETGLLGFGAMIAIYGLTWLRLIRLARRAPTRPARALALAAAIVLLNLLAVSILDNYLELTRVTSLAWLLAATALAAAPQPAAQPRLAPAVPACPLRQHYA